MKNDFILLDNIAITYYYGRFSKVDESVAPLSEAKEFPSPNTSLFSKIYLVTDGSYEATVNGTVFTIRAGDLLLVPSGVSFRFNDTFKKFSQYWAHFNMSYMNDKNSDFLMSFKTGYVYHTKNKSELKEIKNIFERMISSASQSTLLAKFTTKSTLMFLVSFCLNNLNAVDLDSDGSLVKVVNTYVYNNINEKITTADLAKLCNMSAPYFIRLFKKETGLTPLQYVINKKFEIVRGLLDNTSLSVNNIMFNVGFMDASSFARAFKKYAGISPSEYRQKIKTDLQPDSDVPHPKER